jgi:hypothetical protein
VQKPDQYVKIDISTFQRLFKYLRSHPWEDVNGFLSVFETLAVYQDAIKPDSNEEKPPTAVVKEIKG